mgnify:CR=1 FL=1
MSIKGKHLLHRVQHGIDSSVFKPLDKSTKLYKDTKNKYLSEKEYEFVIGFNSRNAHRKHPSNLIMAFKVFCDHLPKEKADKCALVLHSDLVQDAGTDLIAVAKAVCSEYKVVVKNIQHTADEICAFYNMCDVVANVSSNEGFGLSVAEAMMCEKPIIATVTGGLQDQMGFVDDEGNEIKLDLNFSTNSTGKYKKHGKWVKPLFPKVQNLQGSPPTPYIFDDLVDYKDISDAIMYWYLAGNEKRNECGKEGRRWALNEGEINSKKMCEEFIKAMDFTLDNFVKEDRFNIYTPSKEYELDRLPENSIGMELHKIDVESIKKEVENI